MAGITALRRLYVAKESVAGTVIPATHVFRGMALAHDRRTVEMVEEHVGYRGGLGRTNTPALMMGISMPSQAATFEQIGWVFNAGIKGVAGVQDGTGPYVYTYPVEAQSADAIYTYCFEAGNNQEKYAVGYGFVESFTLSGESRQPVMFSAEWVGRQEETLGSYASLTPPIVEEINFGKGSLYIDDDTVGSTQISSTLLSMQIDVTTGLQAMFTGDGGELYFDHIAYTVPLIEVSLTYLHNGTAETERGKFKSETERVIRLHFDGSTIADGVTYDGKALRIDFAGKYLEWEALDSVDGNDVVTAKLQAYYSPDEDLFAEFVVVNGDDDINSA